MGTEVPFDKGERWRRRAGELRSLAAAAKERAVRDNLLAMAEAFERYALKWEGTALVFRFKPRPRVAVIGPRRQCERKSAAS